MIETYIESLQRESDRGCTSIGVELISDALQKKIERMMQGNKKLKEELFNGLGPLSTFSAKIKLSYCFNVISDSMYKELNCLRSIRNIAAHSIEDFSFDHENVKKNLSAMCLLEKTLTSLDSGVISQSMENESIKELMLAANRNGLFIGRVKYNYTVAVLYGMLEQ